MLSPELIAKVKNIQLRASHLVTENLAGEYHSAFKGQGIEFDELREYIPGDDIRSIDWKVTARIGSPYVKIFKEEREQTLVLLVDVSPSQDYASHFRLKREVAAELAAILAFLAIRNNDKVGVILFSDHVEHFIPPKKGRGHVWNIIRTVLSYEPKGKGTDINVALDFLGAVVHRRAMCFVISDFIAGDFTDSLARISRRHDTTAVRIVDRAEAEAVDVGLIEIEDSEDGGRSFIHFSKQRSQTWLNDIQHNLVQSIHSQLARARINYFEISTSEDTVDPLTRFLRRKERRRR